MQALSLFSGSATADMEAAALGVMRSGQIASGPAVAEFERELAVAAGLPRVVSTSDMTSAMMLALHLAGVRAGDEVATTAYTCLSSTSPLARLGARPVWVDLDAATATMSVPDLRRIIGPQTKAVVLYHAAGYPGPAPEVAQICREAGAALIEDCNTALGATLDARPVGTFGDYAVHSFYPNRQVNALDGGALSCADPTQTERASRLRRFGIDPPRFRDAIGEIDPAADVPEVGWSAGMSQLHAAVGLAHLKTLPERAARTAYNARRLQAQLDALPGVRPIRPLAGAVPAYWGFLCSVPDRERVLARLKATGVMASKLHHRNDTYSGLHGRSRELPGTDAFMGSIVALPCGWWLDDSQIDRIAEALKACLP